MLLRGVVAIPVVLVAAAVPALADDYSLHVTAAGQAAWTDNLYSTATDADADLYYQFRPGALGSWETPRVVATLAAEIEADLYQQHSEAWSLQEMLTAQVFALTSPRTELTAGLTASTGTLATLATRNPASQTTVGGGQSGEVDFRSLDATEHLSFTPTHELRTSESVRARLFSTEDQTLGGSTDGLDIGLTLAADRSWQFSAVSLAVGSSLVTLSRHDAAGMALDSSDQIYGTGVVTWRRDLARRWSTSLDGGLTVIVPTDAADEVVRQPTVGATLGYFPTWGQAGLTLRRSVAPNLVIAENTVNDAATANARLPLPWLSKGALEPRLIAEASLGAQRTQLIDTSSGDTTSGFNVYTIDLAVGYVPRPGVAVSLRYQHLRQDADAMSLATVVDYTRNTILLNVTSRFPERVAAEMPVRESLRVDRSDVTPVGEELPGARPIQ